MAEPPVLATRIEQLLGYFNRGTLDLPDGLLDPHCIFRLNGTTYGDALGQSAAGTLGRMLTRGPVAYRFIAQAVRYPLPDARVALTRLRLPEGDGDRLASGDATLSGTLRGLDRPFEASASFVMVLDDGGVVREVAAVVDDERLADLDQARRH